MRLKLLPIPNTPTKPLAHIMLDAQRAALVETIEKHDAFYILVNDVPQTRSELLRRGVSLRSSDYIVDPVPDRPGYIYVTKKIDISNTLRKALVQYVTSDQNTELSADDPCVSIGELDTEIVASCSDAVHHFDPKYVRLLNETTRVLKEAGIVSEDTEMNPIPLFHPTGYTDPKIPFYHLDLGKKEEALGRSFYIVGLTQEPRHTTVVVNEPVVLQEFSRIGIRKILRVQCGHDYDMYTQAFEALAVDIEYDFYIARSKAIESFVASGHVTTSHIPVGHVMKVNRGLHRSPDIVRGREDVSRLVIGICIAKSPTYNVF